MSASIQESESKETNQVVAPSEPAKVVQLPLDESAIRRKEAARVNQALRKQLALLSQHYAEDTTRLQGDLQQRQAALDTTSARLQKERTRSANTEAALFELRGDLTFLRERLAQERRRAARMAEVARLPWWAFARRRWSLSAIAADEAL